MDIAYTLTTKYPGTLWTLNGDSYEGLEWLDESPKPTKKQLEALCQSGQIQYDLEYAEVQRLREEAYLAESDLLKFKWEETLDAADHKAFLDSKAAIRERYPYPAKP